MTSLTGEEIQKRLAPFAARWSVYDGSERGEAQTFVNELLPEVGRFGPLSGAPSGIIGGADLPQDELLAPGLAVAVPIAWASAAFAAAAASLRGRDLV